MSVIALDETSQSRERSTFRRNRDLFFQYLKPYRGRVALMSGLLLAGIALQLANPQVIRYFLDTAQAGGAARQLTAAAGVFIVFSVFQEGLKFAAAYATKNLGWLATNRLRSDLALHCLRLDMPFHKQHTPGELIERIDGDVTLLANFFSEFAVQVFGNGLLVIGILGLLMREDIWVGLGMVIYTGVTLLLLGRIQKLALPRWTAARQASAEQYGFLEERLTGVEEIRAAGAEAYVMRRLYALMRNFLEKFRMAWVTSSLAYSLTNLVYAFGYAAGLALGVTLYLQGSASLGSAYLIVYYVGMLGEPLQHIREQLQDLQQASAGLQRIQELLALMPQVNDPVRSDRVDIPPGTPRSACSVAFQQVAFHYEDNEDVLNEISFEIQPGRVLGILGRTGSGKSTLTRLLFRLYDPTEGVIRLDATDICQIGLSELRQKVAMVTQDVQLFQASVRQNLTFFNPHISDSDLERVLRALHLWEWVQNLSYGLDTPLAAGGSGLSAGEAQLLAFARVLLRDPGLVILDEASSRLDPATEIFMERAIDRLFTGRTGVVIAHRLKTVERADDLLILEGGRVVEYGERLKLANHPDSRFCHLLQTGLEEALA